MKDPKISAIMPIYNGGKYLNYSLSSIQNQDMKDIEIILIDDYSTDNSIMIIEDYMKKDSRIRLIKNNKNKKILYSKSIAALNSKGEYIIELDQDDMFIREDVFQELYYEAKNNSLELVQMRDFVKKELYFYKKTIVDNSGLHFIHPKKSHYKIQPELKDTLFSDNNNYLLWGLLIKNDLYKNSIYRLWPIIINYKIIFNEDYLITSMITKLAKNYKYINKFALIHLMHSKSISYDFYRNNEYYLSLYFYIYFLNEYFIKKNPKNIIILINFIKSYIQSFLKGIKLFPNMFEDIAQIILNNEYLSYKEKEIVFNNLNLDINHYKRFSFYEYMMDKNEFDDIYNFQNIINKKTNKKTNKCKNNKYEITIIIYCIDFKFFNYTFFSIINQINNNNEIIIIYDNYDDNNLKYIKKLTSKYENIRIVNNDNNRGLLYSYSIGVLQAKGEYILSLQPGFTLAKKKSLSILYKEAKFYQIDILEFNLLINNNNPLKNNSLKVYKCLHLHSNNSFNIIKNNKKYKDIEQEKELFCNKLIKTDIYKKVVSKYILNLNNITIYNYYENILYFLFKKYKIKFKHINEYGVIRNGNNTDILKLNNINSKINIINDSIFYINFLFDNSKNTFSDKKIVYQEFINILSIIYNKFTKITNDSIQLIEKFINCKFINKEDKNELQLFYNSLIN